ncbi:MAG: glycosyltransferase family 4 protein [Opitutales bacterium]
MKICFVTTMTIERHASMKRSFGMGPLLASMGHDVSMLLMDTQANRERITDCPGVKPIYFPELDRAEERKFKEQAISIGDFDVTLGNSMASRNFVRPPKGSKTVALMEHCELESLFLGRSRPKRILKYFQELRSLRVFDGTIASSVYLFNLFRHKLFRMDCKRPLLWLPYAYSTEYLTADAQEVTKIREQYGNKKLLVSLATLIPEYGSLFWPEALAELKKLRDDWHAVFLGKGDIDACKALVNQLGLTEHVDYPGFVPEGIVPAYLHASSALLSYLADTGQDWARCPSKVYLYMAAQRPIITAPIGENRAAIGPHGFYYQIDSPKSAAEQMARALDHPDEPVGYPLENHNWQKRCDDFLEWLKYSFPQVPV